MENPQPRFLLLNNENKVQRLSVCGPSNMSLGLRYSLDPIQIK